MTEVDIESKIIYIDYQGSCHPFHVNNLIGEGNHKTFLIQSEFDTFAMKIFSLNDKQFQRESRFSFLSHPRLVPPLLSTTIRSSPDSEDPLFKCSLTSYCSNGTLYSALMEKNVRLESVLVRTLFKQLVEAIEYMHKSQTAHLDIKPENIYLDDSCNLKLGDFDASYLEGDVKICRGTTNFRAPEVTKAGYFDPYKADMYCLGLILFVMASGVALPFSEDMPYLYDLLQKEPKKYWAIISEKNGENEMFEDKQFRKLFEGLVEEDVRKRYDFARVFNSEWMQGDVLSDEQVTQEFLKF